MVDLNKFLGLCLLMGVIRKKKLASYWTTKECERVPFVNSVMSINKFMLISCMFHLNDPANEVQRGHDGYDPWYKVRPVLEELNRTFKQFYVPRQQVSIDESMIGMKNRCCFIQFMPNKRHCRFGIKKFQLCDSRNGYVCHVELYPGKALDVVHDEGQAHAVVMRLMQNCNLLNKGHHLFTDNFYTKPRLADELFDRDTLLTGTVRANSRGLCDDIKQARVDVGEAMYHRQGHKLCHVSRKEIAEKASSSPQHIPHCTE